jgi:RHS repeat-associated protein
MRSKLDLFSTNEKTSPLAHILHTYDYDGNRTKRYDPVHAANSELYTYDNLGQIKSLNRGILNNDHTSVTTVNHSESWNFDKTGNWSQYTKNGNTENRTHNAANELQGIANHDANGNMVLMPGLKGKYDAWNRLVEVRDSSDNLIAQYEYNGLNQRIKKTVNNVETKSFFNENWQELESQTGSEITSYVWGLRYIDDLVLREKGEERLYSLTDPNWNIVAICDSVGDIQERYTYDAFGKRNVFDATFTAKIDTEFNWNRTFTGQVLDIETGLMLYRNRFYNTEFGRFITWDPIGYRSGDKNLYRYVKNETILILDPYGFMKPDHLMPGQPDNPFNPHPVFDKTEPIVKKCSDAKQKFTDWYNKEKENDAWLKNLPSCPCTMNLRGGLFLDVGHYKPHYDIVGMYGGGGGTIMQTSNDWVSLKDEWSIEWQIASSSNGQWSYHSGSKFCVRSKKPTGSQCCYDTNNRLITGGSAAGTADKNTPSHQEADMDPANLAWWLDGGCFGEYSKQYLDVRPPVGVESCPPNEITPKSRECPPNSKGRCCD